MSNALINLRAKGCLLGGAIGDSMGAPLEFKSIGPQPWDKPLDTPIKGLELCQNYGGLALGQVTDDSAMAIQLWESLNSCKMVDEIDLATRYREWAIVTFDIGGTTSSALRESAEHGGMGGGLVAWSKASWNNCGNGSLMRCYPIPVYFREETDFRRIVSSSIRESVITHADPRCAMACACYNVAIHSLLNGKTTKEAYMDALEALPIARGMTYSMYWHRAKTLKIPEKYIKNMQLAAAKGVKMACLDLGSDLIEALQPDPKLYGEIDAALNIEGTSQGFVRVAFREAFWQMLHAKSYSEGVLDVANRGGDADTTGAICGAMLGARFGLDGIPPEWVKTALECDCTQAAGKRASDPIFNTKYHPKAFLATGWGQTSATTVTSPETPKATAAIATN